MVTASHNGAEDNGVKIVERDGGMLSRDWEHLAEMIMNAPELSETIANLNTTWLKGYLFDVNVLATEKSPDPWAKAQTIEEMEKEAKDNTLVGKGRLPIVFIGRDTRDSSPAISEQIIRGLKVMNVEYVDYNLLTTP